MSSQFEITKRSRRPNYSLPNTPAPNGALADGTIQTPRGVAFQQDNADPLGQTAKLAAGTSPILGFVTRHIMKGGPQLADSIYPGRIDLPTIAGQEASFEYAEEVEAEGTDYISGTGLYAITSATALNTKLSFLNGQFCVAQSGQLSEFILVGQLTPQDDTNNCRILARRTAGDFA